LILQALNEHYQRLVKDKESGIAPPGYSVAKVSHAVVLDINGNLLDILPLSMQIGKKNLPQMLLVPEQVKRTSGISANILCDGASYVFGVEYSKDKEIKLSHQKYADFKKNNERFLATITSTESKEVQAVKAYLQKWTPEQALSNTIILSNIEDLSNGSNLVFKVDGCSGYVHEEAVVKYAWDSRLQDTGASILKQCLVTGDVLSIARIHPLIKGVVGSQTSGAAIVSFNVDSFTSYNKSQSYNAPVSDQAAFAYGTALNYLLASKINRVRLADTTMVFWADKKGGKAEETVLAWCFDPVDIETERDDDTRRLDPAAVRQAKTILERVKSGLPVGDAMFNTEARCFILGLAPNAARLSVRFWQISRFGDLLEKIALHYKDMDIEGLDRFGGIISPWRTLKTLAVQEDARNIPPLLGGQFLKSILSGQMYPQTIYNAVLIRCRTGGDHGKVNAIRAAMIKAFLIRKYRMQKQPDKEAMITVSLNESNLNTAYLLGRLFSLLEKVQKDALGNEINATIRDRYFGAASATPGSVFPLLLRLSRHHIAKSAYGNNSDRKIQDVISHLELFPAHLNIEGQGQFILGYYHQNQANYIKNEIKNEKTEEKEG
jgi:CRISPR-associated protein Csd1